MARGHRQSAHDDAGIESEQRVLVMNISLDKVTAEMLKEVMKKKRKGDAKKYLTELIRSLYLSL